MKLALEKKFTIVENMRNDTKKNIMDKIETWIKMLETKYFFKKKASEKILDDNIITLKPSTAC